MKYSAILLLEFSLLVTVAFGQTSEEHGRMKIGSTIDLRDGNAPVSALAYGAKCDGKTNDSSAIQTAVNAMATIGGGTVLIPKGNCYLGNPAIPIHLEATGSYASALGNVILQGVGRGSSQISGANGPLVILSSGSSVRDLTISASAASTPLPRPTAPSVTSSGVGGSVAPGTYYACVAALNSAGNQTQCSPMSAGTTTTGNTSKIVYTWPSVAGAADYNLYIANCAGCTNVFAVLGTHGTTYQFTGPWIHNTSSAPPQIDYTQTVAIALDQTLNANNKGSGYGEISNVNLMGQGKTGIGIECITCLDHLFSVSTISGWNIGADWTAWLGANAINRSNADVFLDERIVDNNVGIVLEPNSIDNLTVIASTIEGNGINIVSYTSHLGLTILQNYIEQGAGVALPANTFCHNPNEVIGILICGGYDNRVYLTQTNILGFKSGMDIVFDSSTTSADTVFLDQTLMDGNPITHGGAGRVLENLGEGNLTLAGSIAAGNGTNTVYRCTTKGTLPVGALTATPADCGASSDTGIRVK